MKKIIFFIALFISANWRSYAQQTQQQKAKQVETYVTQIPDPDPLTARHTTFKYFVDYIKAVYPNAAIETYNTSAAMLTNIVHNGVCDVDQRNLPVLDTIRLKTLALFKYHWKYLLGKYPNNSNERLETAAMLTISDAKDYCRWLKDTTVIIPIDTTNDITCLFLKDTTIYINTFYGEPRVFSPSDSIVNLSDCREIKFKYLPESIAVINTACLSYIEELVVSNKLITKINKNLQNNNIFIDIYNTFVSVKTTKTINNNSEIFLFYNKGFVGIDSFTYYMFDLLNNKKIKNSQDETKVKIVYYSQDTTNYTPPNADSLLLSYLNKISAYIGTEKVQGRLTTNIYTPVDTNGLNITSGLSIDSVHLAIPTSGTVSKTTGFSGLNFMITPSGTPMRNEIANIANTNNELVVYTTMYVKGQPKKYVLHFAVPHFSLADNFGQTVGIKSISNLTD